MLFQKFLETINRVIPVAALSLKPELVAQLNPEKIYLENVRSALGVSTGNAKRICETAVRQGVFSKYVEVLCPGGAAAMTAESEDSLPPTVRCWVEDRGEYEEIEISTKELTKNTFYRVNDATARLYTRTA